MLATELLCGMFAAVITSCQRLTILSEWDRMTLFLSYACCFSVIAETSGWHMSVSPFVAGRCQRGGAFAKQLTGL